MSPGIGVGISTIYKRIRGIAGTAPIFVSAAVANATPTKVTLTYDQALLETPGNVAIENSRISAIKMQLKDSGNQNYQEFKMVIESMDGKYEVIIAEDERFTNLLKTVYGDRLHMPPGYFSKAGVRIKFF